MSRRRGSAVAPLSQAGVVNFEDIAGDVGVNNTEGDQVSGGFRFDSSTNHSHRVKDLFESYNGSTWIGWDNNGGTNTVTMSKVAGGVFGLNSIDFSEFFTATNGTQVQVTCNVNGGGTVSMTVALDGIADGAGVLNDFQTVTFNWANLDSVSFVATAGGGDRWFAMDNLVVDSANRLPEPGSLALAGLSLLVAAGARRRRQA